MNAVPAYRGRKMLASALARAEAWLLEPVGSADPPEAIVPRNQPVVGVMALAAGCGTTTVARAVAAELAARDGGAVAVLGPSPSGMPAPSTASAGRLARAVEHLASERPRTAGRLCLLASDHPTALAAATRCLAPLVLEVGHGQDPTRAASLADHMLLVAPSDADPALAAVVAEYLARLGPEPLVVVNRAEEPDGWSGRPALTLADSRAGAALAVAGREPRGALGAAIAEVVNQLEAVEYG